MLGKFLLLFSSHRAHKKKQKKKGGGEFVKSNGTPKRAVFMESGLYEALQIELNNKWAIRAHLYSVMFVVGGAG